MRLGSFWPPRRTFDRLASEVYYRRTPGIPWLPRDAIEMLPDLFRPTDRCLEWGSGSSTAWLGKHLQSVLAVEHDPAWFDRVSAEMRLSGRQNASVRLLSKEPVARPTESPYVRVIDEFGEESLDVCLIDGEHRAACALAVVPKLRPGALLVLDDAQGFLDHPTRSPHSRSGKGPLDADWARFAGIVDSWRLIWTSDGFSDAAIWIKP